MVALTYRTNDVAKWGTGKGSNLTAGEVDNNFWSIEVAIADLIADRPAPNNIISITATGTQLTVHLQDGTAVGPVPMPVLAFRWLGEWNPSTAYVQLDAFRVTGVGLFFVLLNHTSALTFDEAATDGLGNPLYSKLFEAQSAGLAGLDDVELTSLADGQYIKWNATAGKWVNVTLPGTAGLGSLTDVVLTTPANNQRLAYDTATSKWINKADTLSGQSDVVLTALADTQVLAWHAATSKWINVAAGTGGGGGALSALSDVALTSATNGDRLHYNGTNWVNGPETLAGSSDLVLTSLADKQYLRWDAATSKWINATLPGLAGLSDVAISSITDGQVIAWHAATSKFINVTAAGGAGATNLAALSDVAITSPLANQQLIFNGTYWANVSIAGSVFAGIDLVNGDNNSATEVIEGHGFLDDGAGHNAAWGLLQFKQARGTIASPTATQNGDRLGTIQFIGYGATAIAPYASVEIYAEATENFTDTHHGVRLGILVTKQGTSASVHRLGVLFEDDGGLIVGSATGGSQGDGTVNAEGYFVNGTAVVTLSTLALSSATDVLISSPTNGQVLTYNTAAGKWENQAAGSGSTTLAGDTDVTIASPADNDFLVYINSASKWENKRQHYDISWFVPGTLSNSQVVLMHRFSKAVTIPINFGAYLGRTSQAGGSANATGSTAFNVDKAATAAPNTFSNVGTITIAASGVTPTFASSGGTTISFAAGDVVRIVGPATADATFAGFYGTICGFET